MILNDRAVKAGTRPVTRHQVEWAASGLRRATTEAGVALPIDYSQAVAAAAGLTRAAELGVTRLGVVIHTRPSIDRELPVVVGYADGRGRWSRDGHRHTTTTAPDFSQRGSDAVNGPHGNRPTPPRLTVIARPDTVIEAHGHQAGSPYKGTLDVTAVAIAAIRSGQVDRYCPVTQSGRELSKFQLLRILAVHPSAPVLAFDGDLAGRDSAGRYGQAFTAHGRTVVVTTLPAAHDPASWLAEHGYAGLQAWSGEPRKRRSMRRVTSTHSAATVSVNTAYKWSSRGQPDFPRTLRLRNGAVRVRDDWYEEWLKRLEK